MEPKSVSGFLRHVGLQLMTLASVLPECKTVPFVMEQRLVNILNPLLAISGLIAWVVEHLRMSQV